MKTELRKSNWSYLGREVVLILLLAYLYLIGGTFSGLVAHPVRLASAVLAAVLFGGWLLWRLLRGKRIPRTGLERAWLLLLASMAIAAMFSDDPRRSQSAGLIWLSYALVFYLAVDLLRRGWPAELFEKCLLVGGTIVIGFGLLQFVQLYQSWRAATAGLEFPPSFQQRIGGLVGDPNLMAATLNLLLPLALMRAWSGKSRGNQVLLGIYAAASLVLIYLADSRGGLLALATALGILCLGWVFVLSEQARQLVGRLWKALLAKRVLLYGAAVVIFLAAAVVGWRLLSFEGDTTHAPALTSRQIYWQAAAAAFRVDPLTGVGPGIYPVYLMQLWSTPPARPYLHAHSTPFNFAAESGVLGLGALLFFLWAVWRGARRGWEGLDPAGKARWVGIAAALGGFSVHSLVDDFLPFTITGTTLMLLLAMWLETPSDEGEPRGFSPLWLLLPALLGTVLSISPLRASGHAEAAAQLGNAGDWAAAAKELDTATALDPSFAFYWMQSGYAYGRLAENGAVYVDAAAAAYERAIALEPVYSLNYANLAALQEEVGLQSEALNSIESAVEQAPRAWQFWLSQGLMLENQNKFNEAGQAYQEALSLRPDIAQAAFWEVNTFRREVADSFRAASLEADTSRDEERQLVDAARADIQAGNLEEAAKKLETAWRLYDQDLGAYLGFAELAFARGDLDQAEQYLQAGLQVQSTSNQDKVEMVLLLAEISDRRGDAEAALSRYETAYSAILNLSSYGWGGAGWTPYSYFVFQRQGFAEDTLPQLPRADIPADVAQRLLRLADLYAAQGENAKAQAVRTALRPYLPLDTAD